MDDQHLFDELLRAAERLGIEVRVEPFETPAIGLGPSLGRSPSSTPRGCSSCRRRGRWWRGKERARKGAARRHRFECGRQVLHVFAEGREPIMAQDPVKVDPAHYKVELENANARVLRIKYGPRERSVMHGHPTALGVHLTDGHVRFTFPNGKTEELRFKAGEVRAYPAGEHLPENVGDQPLELVFVELKARSTAKKAAPVRVAKKPATKRAVRPKSR
jgi:quercetin dioxygenase-like cupin family protein